MTVRTVSIVSLLLLALCACPGLCFVARVVTHSLQHRLHAVPLELEGKLNPKNKWEVTLTFNGETKKVSVSEDTCILEAAEKVFDNPPFSCRNGVCTTCSARVTGGKESLIMAVHGLGEPQLDAGFVLSCQSYAVGPGLSLQMGMYDECYESQYGQYERGAAEDHKKKKFGFF